jgi:aspartate carbamoyltransferase catalytic subunit
MLPHRASKLTNESNTPAMCKTSNVQDRPELYDECKSKLIIDEELCKKLKPHAVLMHPLPRVDEIAVGVDKDPRAAYFRQAANGLFIRMALLRLCILRC